MSKHTKTGCLTGRYYNKSNLCQEVIPPPTCWEISLTLSDDIKLYAGCRGGGSTHSAILLSGKVSSVYDFYNQLTKEETPMNNNTLDLASLIADNTPEGMEVCKEKSTENVVVFKEKVNSTRWEDLGYISGYYAADDSEVEKYFEDMVRVDNKHVYATNPQCKAHLAQAQLSQIMQEVNGGWEADWGNRQGKHCISLHVTGYETQKAWGYPKFLAFKSQELAEQVLRENADLLEQYKPLAG